MFISLLEPALTILRPQSPEPTWEWPSPAEQAVTTFSFSKMGRICTGDPMLGALPRHPLFTQGQSQIALRVTEHLALRLRPLLTRPVSGEAWPSCVSVSPARPVVACVPHPLPRPRPAHSHAFERGSRYDNARCPIVCTSLRSASAVPEGCISLIAGLLRAVCSCETVSRATVLMQACFSLPRALRGSVCRPARGWGSVR